jgi:hypothetical protein
MEINFVQRNFHHEHFTAIWNDSWEGTAVSNGYIGIVLQNIGRMYIIVNSYKNKYKYKKS